LSPLIGWATSKPRKQAIKPLKQALVKGFMMVDRMFEMWHVYLLIAFVVICGLTLIYITSSGDNP